jgi:DNA mismatch repair ATPase MutL
LPKAVHQKLREIAFHTDRKIHDVIMDGIDEALKRHGRPTTNALKGRR